MANRLMISAVVVFALAIGSSFAADAQPTTARINPLAFHQADNNEFTFNTTVLRGKLHANGKPMGLTEVVHIPSGKRIDGGAGILSFYRVFTANKRYGTAAWDWPNGKATRLPDGAVEYAWPATDDRPFEFKAVYRWQNPRTIEVETTVTAKADLKGFESFLASYFAKDLATPAAYVAKLPDTDKSGFMIAKKDAGDWQMFPRDEKSAPLIQDGRWKIDPNPVDWMIRPTLAAPLCVRRDAEDKLTVIVMTLPQNCFAVAMPYEGEQHYSMYLSLFGRDLRPGQILKTQSLFVVAESISDAEIVVRYTRYTQQLQSRGLFLQP